MRMVVDFLADRSRCTTLTPVIEFVQPDLLHGNSLSTGRITGLLSQQTA